MNNKIISSVPLCKPDISSLEKEKVMDVLKSGYLSNGPKLREFEKRVSEYLRVPYALGVNSGTSALHLAVRSLGLKEGDEVITTPFSFIASSNCLLMENVKPIFIDIDKNTYNLNPNLIEEKITSKTRAILPIDIFGHSVDMDKILEVSRKYNLPILEDSCEALGSKYKGERIGAKSTIATFGFFPNKQITTGEGGMVITSDKGLAKLCKSMRAHGRNESEEWLSHDRLGYNYKLDEMSAALGVAQMERIDEILEKRKNVAENYIEKMNSIEDIVLPHEEDYSDKTWFTFVIRFKNNVRKEVIKYLNNSNIECRDYFSPIHLQPFYKKKFDHKEGDFPITEEISRKTLALPFYGDLKEEEINYVVGKLKEFLNKNKK